MYNFKTLSKVINMYKTILTNCILFSILFIGCNQNPLDSKNIIPNLKLINDNIQVDDNKLIFNSRNDFNILYAELEKLQEENFR